MWAGIATIVDRLVRTYDNVVMALAVIAGALLTFVFVAIVYDVTLRTVGLQPPFWTLSSTEYALLYVTTLGAPWLLHHKGHVVITTVTSALPPKLSRVVGKLAMLIGAISCLLIAGVSLKIAVTITGFDVRSFDMPRWLVYVTMPVGFLLLAIEFARFLFGSDTLLSGAADRDKGL